MSVFNNPFAKSGESKAESKVNPSGKDTTKQPAGKLDVDDVEDFLSSGEEDKVEDDKVDDEDETEEEPVTVKADDEDDEEGDDDTEEEDKVELKEEEDEDKEKLDLKEEEEKDLNVPPKKKEILAKYPKFFEEFPSVERIIFRDKAYSEMFGSFDEAKEVFNKVERLNEFETQLLSGDTKDVLSTVKEADPKAFDKIVDNYLKSLFDVDPDAYKDVTENFAKRIILGMADHAKKKGDKELDDAAKRLHEFLFDTDQWTDMKVRVKSDKSEEEESVAKERAALTQERFESARDGLTVKVDNVLKSTIAEHIDPRQAMTPYEKKHAVDETLKRLHEKVGSDPAFRKNLDRLWKAAFGDKFSSTTLDSIKRSYLGKSRVLLSSVIKEVRTEVLKGNKSVKGKEKKEEETPQVRKSVNAGRPHQQTVKANERQKGETVEDFLGRE